MSGITPTPPTTGMLVNETPLPPIAVGTPTALPAALPVQVIALPAALPPPAQTPVTIDGMLQLLLNGKATFTTDAGDVTLNLPQLPGNPALFQAIKNFVADGTPLQLKLQPNVNGVLDAQLLFPVNHVAQTAVQTTSVNLTSFIGQTLQAILLPPAAKQPSGGNAPGSSAKSGPGQAQGGANSSQPASPPITPQAATASQRPTPQQPGGNRLEQIIRSMLPAAPTVTAAAAQPPAQSAAAATGPLPVNLQASSALTNGAPVLNLKLQQIIPPGQPLPQLQPDEVLLTVPDQAERSALPLVTSGNSSLLLKTAAPLLPGSTLLVKLLPGATPGTLELHEPKTWPALQELLNNMATSQAPALQRFQQLRLPQGNAALPGALLFVLSALQSGDSAPWLGHSGVSTIEQNQKTLLDALQQEFRHAVSTTSDPVVGEWRSYQLPVLDQNQLQPLHIYVHHNLRHQPNGGDGQTQEAQTPVKQTRFIIDVTFTRLGKMQFDGFVQAKQFDLVMRSEQPIAPELRDELRAAFADAVTASGYQGQMLFQTGNHNWLYLAPNLHDNRRI